MTQPDKLVVSQEASDAATKWLTGQFGFEPGDGLSADEQAEFRLLSEAFQRAMNQAADERQEMCAKVAERYPMRADFTKHDTINGIASAIRSIGKGGM